MADRSFRLVVLTRAICLLPLTAAQAQVAQVQSRQVAPAMRTGH